MNTKSIKYDVYKLEKITRSNNSKYIIAFPNQTSKEVIFTNNYNNYDELINPLNTRSS